MKHATGVYITAVFFIVLFVVLFFWEEPFIYISEFITEQGAVSYVLFVLLLTVATVFAPVTVLPIIPAVAPIFGPFTTGILSIVGWTIGASIEIGRAHV